jgi:hypothetical protein
LLLVRAMKKLTRTPLPLMTLSLSALAGVAGGEAIVVSATTTKLKTSDKNQQAVMDFIKG